jgi:hypothetical protein
VIRPAADVSASCHVRQCGVAEDRNQEVNDRVPRQFSRACRRAWASLRHPSLSRSPSRSCLPNSWCTSTELYFCGFPLTTCKQSRKVAVDIHANGSRNRITSQLKSHNINQVRQSFMESSVSTIVTPASAHCEPVAEAKWSMRGLLYAVSFLAYMVILWYGTAMLLHWFGTVISPD